MSNEITQSLSRVIHQAIRHCCTKRLAGYQSIELPKEFYDEVGSEMITLFEMRLAQWQGKTPPTGMGTHSDYAGAKPSRQRGRA